MAYSEVIKNFNKIRDYMREFYLYGFKSRDEYTGKSARSYDDERRRIESWLGDYMSFRQTPDAKNVFISIDSRTTHHNPLYKAWKTKSFTDGDITLHFMILDILKGRSLSMQEFVEELDSYLSEFEATRTFDESTVRKKLKEYTEAGMVKTEKRGKALYYSLTERAPFYDKDVLDFFSEVAPCGVIGSYLLDKTEGGEDMLAFKHHYITGAMDSEVLYSILEAMSDKREVELMIVGKKRSGQQVRTMIPLRIMISVQNGRQYLMSYVPEFNRVTSCRIDSIVSVKPGAVAEDYDKYREILDKMEPHIWGVSTSGISGSRIEHVDFTVTYNEHEQHIPKRLEREKRCGTVEILDDNHCRFSADVYDTSELIPWIRSFICRITDINFSNKDMEKRFKDDIRRMYRMYGIGGDENDIQ